MRLYALVPTLLLCAFALAPTALAQGSSDQGVLNLDTADFSMRIGVFLQAQATYVEGAYDYSGDYFTFAGPDGAPVPFADTDIDGRGDFRLRTARISAYGRAFLPFLNYLVEFDAGQLPAGPGQEPETWEPRVTDAYVSLNFSDALNFRIGQFKQPFDIFFLMNTRTDMMPELPVGTVRHAPLRDVGLMYHGSALDKRLNWHLALSNGNGLNNSSNDDSDFQLVGRLEWQNAGGFRYRATAADHPDRLEYTAGVAFARNTVSDTAGATIDDVGLPCLPGTSFTCSYEGRDTSGLELFGALRGRRFQVNGTAQKWTYEDAALDNIDPFLAQPTDLDRTYVNVDAGYFVTDNIEIFGRLGYWENDDTLFFWTGEEWTDELQAADPLNIGFVGATDVSSSEWRLGATYYLAGHGAKFLVDVGQVEETVKKNDYLEPFPLGAGEGTFTSSGVRMMFSFAIPN